MEQPRISSPQPCQTGSVLLNLEQIEDGKPSVLKSYCEQAIYHGGSEAECIWLCMQHGRKWIARDIKFNMENPSLGIDKLRGQCGWWKRHSMFTAVGVKEVQIRFLSISEVSNDVEVVIRDFDYVSTTRNIEQELVALDEDTQSDECGVDVTGRSHDTDSICLNEAYDQYTEDFYCRAQRARKLEQLKGENEWLPSMLEFYWQNGIGTKGAKFLKATGFLVSYESLKYDRFHDAANPYGKTTNAFKIVEGWRLRYLLFLVVSSVSCSICIVAVIAVITQSLEDGLTAGSYSLALATISLAVLAFLSAVL